MAFHFLLHSGTDENIRRNVRISDLLFQHGSRHGKDLPASILSADAVQVSIKKRIDKHVVWIAEQVLIPITLIAQSRITHR
jgi:hypothetical protein